MQHFDLYNEYSILKTMFLLLKFPFRVLGFHLSSRSSPFFFPPLTTQEPTPEHPVQFVPLIFEELGPDTLDTVFCLASSSSMGLLPQKEAVRTDLQPFKQETEPLVKIWCVRMKDDAHQPDEMNSHLRFIKTYLKAK